MNVSKLIVLGSLDQLGKGSGYDVIQDLKQKMIHKWLDVNTGSTYYTIKQLSKDGHIQSEGQAQQGEYPTKTLYSVTKSGQQLFDTYQAEAFKGLFPHFYGFKLALKFNSRRSPEEIEQFAHEAYARIDDTLAAMDNYLGSVEQDSWQHEFDGFFIEHDRRLYLEERKWIEAAVEWVKTSKFQHNQRNKT